MLTYLQHGELGSDPEAARAALSAAHGGDASGDGLGHPRRDRPVQAVVQARGGLRGAVRGRGRARRRPQPRGHACRYRVSPGLPAPGCAQRGRIRGGCAGERRCEVWQPAILTNTAKYSRLSHCNSVATRLKMRSFAADAGCGERLFSPVGAKPVREANGEHARVPSGRFVERVVVRRCGRSFGNDIGGGVARCWNRPAR